MRVCICVCECVQVTTNVMATACIFTSDQRTHAKLIY